MSLISAVYLLFVFAVVAGYYVLPGRARIHWLLLAGYIFYFTWQPAFLVVLVAETIAAYAAGHVLASAGEDKKKKWLAVSVSVLFLPLIFFKYFNVLNDHIAALLGTFAIESPVANHSYLIPLGISFFTFQAVSYVVDTYRGYNKTRPPFVVFAVYMGFFPTILAGPIERAKSMLEQIGSPAVLDYQNIRAGLQLILWGVFKKVVIADRLATVIDPVYANPSGYPGVMIYGVILVSIFQIFCDFSAYSDIAVGVARLLGIRLSKNFDDRVYAATSREIFWQGWHRSLTGWLRDYVFFPLSKGVRQRSRLYLNLLIVYLLVGIWHGAAWGFVIWGVLNGLWLVMENATKEWRKGARERLGVSEYNRVFLFASWLVVFHAGALFGVFFRTNTPVEAVSFLSHLGNSNSGPLGVAEFRSLGLTGIFILLMDLVNRKIPKNENFDAFIGSRPVWFRWGFYFVVAQLILRYIEYSEGRGFNYFLY